MYRFTLSYYNNDRSTQSQDPEALDGQSALTLGILVHFSSF